MESGGEGGWVEHLVMEIEWKLLLLLSGGTTEREKNHIEMKCKEIR